MKSWNLTRLSKLDNDERSRTVGISHQLGKTKAKATLSNEHRFSDLSSANSVNEILKAAYDVLEGKSISMLARIYTV